MFWWIAASDRRRTFRRGLRLVLLGPARSPFCGASFAFFVMFLPPFLNWVEPAGGSHVALPPVGWTPILYAAAALDSIGIVRAFAALGKLSSTIPSFNVAVAFSVCTSAGSSITRMI